MTPSPNYAELILQTYETNKSQGPRIWARAEYLGYPVSCDFPPETSLEDIMSWANDPLSHAATQMSPAKTYLDLQARRIAYNIEDGKLHILASYSEGGQMVSSYDPLNEESMVKLVRHLQGLAFANAPHPPREEQPLPLPKPTNEQMANRQIFTNAKAAHGVSAPRRRKPSITHQPSEVVQKKLNNILDSILASRNTD